MRATVTGTIVETDRNEWAFNGKTGVSYAVFLRAEGASAAQGAQRIRVSAEQFGAFSEGDQAELPVEIFANTTERQGVVTGAKLSVTLREDYVHSKGVHSVTSLAI